MRLHQVDRVVLQPALPARLDQFSRFQVERDAKSQRRPGIRVVGGRHAEVHDRMGLGRRQLGLGPDGLEEATNPAIVAAVAESGRRPRRVVGALAPRGLAVLVQLVERVRPVAAVDEIEVGVAGVIGDGAPVLGVFHAVDDGAVAARGLAETASMLARGQRAELAVDEGDDFPGQVVGIAADGGGVDVLVAAESREAVGKHEDGRSHPALMHQARRALGQVLAEGLPAQVRQARAREPDQVVQGREAAIGVTTPGIVLGRQPHGDLAVMGIAEGIVPQDPGNVLEYHDRTRGPDRVPQCHIYLPLRRRRRLAGPGRPLAQSSRPVRVHGLFTSGRSRSSEAGKLRAGVCRERDRPRAAAIRGNRSALPVYVSYSAPE